MADQYKCRGPSDCETPADATRGNGSGFDALIFFFYFLELFLDCERFSFYYPSSLTSNPLRPNATLCDMGDMGDLPK